MSVFGTMGNAPSNHKLLTVITAQVPQYGIWLEQHQVSILDHWQLTKNLQDVKWLTVRQSWQLKQNTNNKKVMHLSRTLQLPVALMMIQQTNL